MEVVIYKDNIPSVSFRGDNAENEAWIWLLRNQPQSTDYALRYGGYRVRVYPNDGLPEDWKPTKRLPYRIWKDRPKKKK